MQRQLLFALAASATFVCQCVGGPHLGMKLAVREFGDAWKTGNRNLIAASVTPDFRFALFELSQDEFAKLWSPNSGNLVRTAKHGGWGTIYLSTARGPVEVTVRGSGFDWAVSDVRSPDQTGVMTSFRDVVQVTAAAQTFVRSLRDSDSAKARTVSSSMLSDALESGEWAEFTSAVKRQKVKPMLLIRGDTATISMAPDEGSTEPAAQMSLLRQSQRWIVDDFSIHTTRLTLVSAKTGLPSLAVVSHLANQLSGTCKVDTSDFIASAELRRELDWLATLRIHPFKGTQTQFEHIEVSDDGCLVQVKLKEGMDQVRIQLTKDDERCRIAHVDLTQNGTSQPLAMRLAVFRRLTQTPKEGFNGLIQAAAFLTGEE